MKPSFALTLANDSIGLLHRTPEGWHSLGTVAQDDPDLAEALAYLRRSALGLEPQGFATKLVIPNSEILYLTAHAPGPSAALRRAQVAAALEGRTPYELSELAFDWSGTGDLVQVAAVARETLDMAEGFAVEHGFNPVSFVAMPEPGSYAAEPWFGLTAAAPGLLAPGEKVIRDQDPIRIVDRTAREAAPEETPQAEPVDEDVPAPDALPDPVPEPDPLPEPAPEPTPEPETLPEPAPVAPEPEPITEPVPEPDAAPEPDPLPDPEPAMVPAPVDPQPQVPPPELTPEPVPEAPMIIDADPVLDWPTEPTSEADPLDAAKAALAASLTPSAATGPAVSGARKTAQVPSDDDDLPPAPSAPILRAVAAARSGTDVATAPKLTDKVQKALGKAARTGKGNKVKIPAQRPANAPPPPPLPPAATQPNVPSPKSEAEAMTVFGQRRERIGGKPRFLGLALTGVLLALLLLVAVWAAMFLDAPQDASVVPEPAAETLVAEPAPEAGVSGDSGLADASRAVTPTAEPAPETLAATVEPETVVQPETAPVAAEPAPAAAEGALDVATAPRGPEAGSVEELTLPLPDQALDATPQARLAAASGANSDQAPAAPIVLPEFGALYQFDAEGRIVPTPEGVVTPEGFTLMAGRPAIVPPARPASAEPAAPVTTPTPEAAPVPPGAIALVPPTAAPAAAPAATESVGPYQPDDSFAGNRPRTRPAGLAPEVPAAPAAAQEGALPAFSDQALAVAARRPPVRPGSIAAAAEAQQARRLAEAAAAAAAAASTAAQTEALAAMAPTRRPPARPAALARAVETAVAAAVATPRVATPQPAVARQAAPVSPRGSDGDVYDDGEPDTPASAPSIPTRASVARQATVSGALNLGRTNLIGVFGASNSRYALVRESSGRLVRVKVGDRLDGGRVTAIGQADISYQRGSNTVRLTMPRT